MMQFQKNKLFRLTAALLLVGFAGFAFHFLAHAIHLDDKDDASHCPVCQFIAILAFILFFLGALFFRLRREHFHFKFVSAFFSPGFFNPHFGRAPPLALSSAAFL